jgi:hypothetical protein
MTLTRDMQRLRVDIEELREERGATLAGIRHDVLAIHDRTGAFLETSRNELSGAADEGRRERAAFMTKLDKEGEALRAETVSFLQEAHESHMSSADEGRHERAAFMSSLSSEGERARTECSQRQQTFAADLAGARKAWLGGPV